MKQKYYWKGKALTRYVQDAQSKHMQLEKLWGEMRRLAFGRFAANATFSQPQNVVDEIVHSDEDGVRQVANVRPQLVNEVAYVF